MLKKITNPTIVNLTNERDHLHALCQNAHGSQRSNLQKEIKNLNKKIKNFKKQQPAPVLAMSNLPQTTVSRSRF